jgi:hypothetical protein
VANVEPQALYSERNNSMYLLNMSLRAGLGIFGEEIKLLHLP